MGATPQPAGVGATSNMLVAMTPVDHIETQQNLNLPQEETPESAVQTSPNQTSALIVVATSMGNDFTGKDLQEFLDWQSTCWCDGEKQKHFPEDAQNYLELMIFATM